MAEPPILTLAGAGVAFGDGALLRDASLAVHPGERIALVGRNGSGKSTLLRLMAGRIEPDAGTRFLRPGLAVGLMEQEPDFAGYPTLFAFAARGLEPAEHHRVEAAFQGLDLDPDRAPDAASGGERRRAALARLVARDPDLMLLDEPTNHLDIAAIGWLEAHLARARSAQVIVSHDRAFLAGLTRRTFWLDRGVLRVAEHGFAGFEAWRDAVFAEEDAARHKRDRLIAAEGRWAVEGISARRRRNQGRLRRLADLREARRAEIARAGAARLDFAAGERSGRLVVEATGIAKAFGGSPVVRDLSIRIARGERVALVGPNGAGKTTLLRLLTGALAPDAGTVRLGTNLVPAILDQNRAALDPALSLAETLGGPGTAPTDTIAVRGRAKNVVAYLRDFLFPEVQARGPVAALSGGEKARLLLATLMMREANLLVLDEPTNDLDVETLDLLEEIVAEFDGTVILVSHDRDFIDRIATTTVAAEGGGRWGVYAGGWSDHLAQRGAGTAPPAAGSGSARVTKPAAVARREAVREAVRPVREPRKLGFREAHRLEALPGEIDRLAAEIGRIEALLADPGLYARDPARFEKATALLADRRERLAAAEEEWLALAERQEALERG